MGDIALRAPGGTIANQEMVPSNGQLVGTTK